MIKIKALNEDLSTSDSDSEELENGILTREAQEEHLQQLYCQALKLVDSDKEQAKSELIDLLDTLDEFDESSGLTNIIHLKYLSLKNLGLLSVDNLEYFLDALAIDGGDVTLWIETGRRALNHFINLPLARACFEEAIRISPTNWAVLDILMGLYFVLNDYSNCLKLALKGLARDHQYFKAHLLISEMLKRFPPISSDIPEHLLYIKNWNPSQKDLDRKVKILSEFECLKQQRKRKLVEDETNQANKRKNLSLNLESSSLSSLQSLTSTLKRIYIEMDKVNCPRSTLISIESETSSDNNNPNADENMVDECTDKEKLMNRPEKRGSFPFEFIDKRRSSRVQKIQNKTSDSWEFSSDNIYEKIFYMIPQSVMTREIKVKKAQVERPQFNDAQVENSILTRFISKQKKFKSNGRRIHELIDDLLYELADQAVSIKLPSGFIDLYKIHRQVNCLPSPLTCTIDDIILEEIKLIMTANEIDFQSGEIIFLTQMIPHLKELLTPIEYDQFFIRLLTLRGTKESQVDYLLMANEILTNRNLKLVQASNQNIYDSSSLKSMINTLNENNLDKLLDQHRHEELIELLSSKLELSESEEEYLCQAIQSSKQWRRGVEIIASSKQLTERLLELLRACLKHGDGVSIDRELAIKLLKLGTEKHSTMAWVCILQTFINEWSVGQIDEKKIVNFIDTIHQYLGFRSACCKANGEFLLLSLDFTINRCSKVKDETILQCFACLYNHPPPRPQCSFLTAHSGAGIPLRWENVDIIYSYFVPEDLPEFDSVKRVSIDSDTEELLCRILPLIPDNLSPENEGKLVKDYLNNGTELSSSSTVPKNHVTQNLYYFLADYYFKNKEFKRARNLYILDLALNRNRFDSWAACALSITHYIDQYFSSGGDIFYSAVDKVIGLVGSSFRCYTEALRLEQNNTKIWIEYGNLAYNVASYISRVCKARPSILEATDRDKLIEQKKMMLQKARICFESANNTADTDEIWLQYYFLGKIAERSDILQALRYYQLSDLHLALSGATYPRKIGYHNPSRLAIEALEVHYRIHACVLKYLRRHGNKKSQKILTTIKTHLIRALRSPFVKQIQTPSFNSITDHDYISSQSRLHPALGDDFQVTEDVKEVVSDLVTLVNDDNREGDGSHLRRSLMEMCHEAMNRCLQRFPNHYKSLYRMAHHLCSLKEFQAARIALLDRFTPIVTSQSLLKRPDITELSYSNVVNDLSKAEPIIGLFGDHKNNNLFNGIWRIPVDDIDRPGSFITHMQRSTQLLIKVSWALADIHRLSTIAVQLSKVPEVGKKFLRDIDREHLAKEAVHRCFYIMKSRIEEARLNPIRLEQIRIDLRKVADKLLKCPVYQREASHYVTECERLIRTIR